MPPFCEKHRLHMVKCDDGLGWHCPQCWAESGAPLQPGATQPEHDGVSHEPETFTNQRLFDLVRYKRSELHTDGLISDDEYAVLAQDHAAVARLEDYDGIKQKVADIPTLLERMARLVAREAAKVMCQYCAAGHGHLVNRSGFYVCKAVKLYDQLTPEKLQQLREAVERP